MAHIVDFEVIGLAGRNDVYSQKLNRDVNVFFGVNGSGKTSLLMILHSALTGDGSMLRKVPFREARVKIYSVDYHEVLTRTIKQQAPPAPRAEQRALFLKEAVWLFEGKEESKQLPVAPAGAAWTTDPERASKSRLGHRYLPTSRLWVSPDFQRHTISLSRADLTWEEDVSVIEERLNASFQESLERLWTGYVREVLSKVREAQEGGLTNILKEVLSTERRKPKGAPLDSETAYDRVRSFLTRQQSRATFGSKKEFERRYRRSPVLRHVVGHINEVELGIERAMAPRDKLSDLISKMFTGEKKVRFTDTAIEIETTDKTQISLASLSSGEKHALRILIETLYAEGGPLLIDEPELSMHVDWQKELIPSMRGVNKAAQLILATHSPEIMAPVGDDKIFRL